MKWLLLLALAPLAPGCDLEADAPASPCPTLCRATAECDRFCDPVEEPGCDPDRKYREALARCMNTCQPAFETRSETCPVVAGRYAECVDGRSCGDQSSACGLEQLRYHEVCLDEPGSLVCPQFCAEIATGCLPFEWFGMRSPACEATCGMGALDPSCREAHYALATCGEAHGYACEPIDGRCTALAQAVEAECEPWISVEPEPAEVAFCADVAPSFCRCGIWEPGDTCALRAERRCLFELGRGAACRERTEAFAGCLEALDPCDRDAARAHCLPLWEAWTATCAP